MQTGATVDAAHRADADRNGLAVEAALRRREVQPEAATHAFASSLQTPRGELAAISLHTFVRHRAFAYCWNPVGLHRLPQ